jgi:SAM-dependent methyltransferase
MARRFPGTVLTGVEFDRDWVSRARANVAAAGLSDRIVVEDAEMTAVGHAGDADLVYFQHALHRLADPAAVLLSAWGAVRPGGWLVALDWYLASDPDDVRTHLGEILAGMQLDELVEGKRLATRSEALGWFADAGLPTPELIELPSGASAIVARR